MSQLASPFVQDSWISILTSFGISVKLRKCFPWSFSWNGLNMCSTFAPMSRKSRCSIHAEEINSYKHQRKKQTWNYWQKKYKINSVCSQIGMPASISSSWCHVQTHEFTRKNNSSILHASKNIMKHHVKNLRPPSAYRMLTGSRRLLPLIIVQIVRHACNSCRLNSFYYWS